MTESAKDQDDRIQILFGSNLVYLQRTQKPRLLSIKRFVRR